MALIEKIAFLFFLAAAAYGASIGPMVFRDESNNLLSEIDRDNFGEDTPVSSNHVTLADPGNGFEIGKVVTLAVRTLVDVFQRMEITEQSLKSVMQLVASLVSSYFGTQSQLILPVLTALSSALFRSLVTTA